MIELNSVCVFLGSREGRVDSHLAATRQLGAEIARRGIRLVYGGGHVGFMGVLADTVLEHGGSVTGVIPRALVERELAHAGLTELRVVDSMHERKTLMAELADGFIALPGGFGTLEEFFEALTWNQLGIHRKPCVLYNAGDYFSPLITFIDGMITTGLVRAEHRSLLSEAHTPAEALDQLKHATLPSVEKWAPEDQVQP